MKHFVLSQVVASLECCLGLVEHVVNLLHGEVTELLGLFLIGVLYQMVSHPAHVADAECAVEIFKQTG